MAGDGAVGGLGAVLTLVLLPAQAVLYNNTRAQTQMNVQDKGGGDKYDMNADGDKAQTT